MRQHEIDSLYRLAERAMLRLQMQQTLVTQRVATLGDGVVRQRETLAEFLLHRYPISAGIHIAWAQLLRARKLAPQLTVEEVMAVDSASTTICQWVERNLAE
jgi:hypothetical protein